MVSTTHYVTKCAKMMSRAPISARKAEAAGMQHLGAVARRRPGPRDTPRAHQAGGRASPGEHGDHWCPKMVSRGPLPVIHTNFISQAAFAATAAALGRSIARKPAADDNLGPDGGWGRDAAPGSGHASSARPRGHYLGIGSWWMRAPQRDQAPPAS